MRCGICRKEGHTRAKCERGERGRGTAQWDPSPGESIEGYFLGTRRTRFWVQKPKRKPVTQTLAMVKASPSGIIYNICGVEIIRKTEGIATHRKIKVTFDGWMDLDKDIRQRMFSVYLPPDEDFEEHR